MKIANEHDQFRITMAAIDPSEEAEVDENSNTTRPRATLKIIRKAIEEDDDEDDDEYMRALLGDSDSDSEDGLNTDDLLDEPSDEDENGGPSDPAKSKKAKKAAAIKELLQSLGGESGSDSDEEMGDAANGTNGTVAVKKGKAKANEDDEEDEDDDETDSDDEDVEVEQFVLCTLDPEKVSWDNFISCY